jgi:hypothetical protein
MLLPSSTFFHLIESGPKPGWFWNRLGLGKGSENRGFAEQLARRERRANSRRLPFHGIAHRAAFGDQKLRFRFEAKTGSIGRHNFEIGFIEPFPKPGCFRERLWKKRPKARFFL